MTPTTYKNFIKTVRQNDEVRAGVRGDLCKSVAACTRTLAILKASK
jgi:hypothetical protein